MKQHIEALTQYLVAFITGLVQSGVKDVVISPGSRSTPLALLFAEHRELQTYINIDERSAAFFALGLAKSSNKPVVLLCTSGTAAANFFPAVVEANLSRVPLIVLTADRPHELRDVGAPQAIDQLHLYGNHVRWFSEMALPEESVSAVKYAKTAAIRAVKEATSLMKGPVHLNFPLREPLIPQLEPYPFPEEPTSRMVEAGSLQISNKSAKKIVDAWQKVEKGIIICGQIDEQGFPQAVQNLAEKLGFPILADPLSQVRSSQQVENFVIDSYDAILKATLEMEQLKPELIIRFGGSPVSKPLSLYIKKYDNIPQYIIDSGEGWRDPQNTSTMMIYSNEVSFCDQITNLLPSPKESKWQDMWMELDNRTKDIISSQMKLESELEEGKAVYELINLLPMQSTVFVGNSMPIRDFDTFFHKNEKDICIMANRGANGIDGVVSTALGASIYKRPMFLVIGDLSFFHDLNGLLLAKLHKLNITIIVLNNDGGGIFSYLPQSAEEKHFEVLFGTPTGLNYEHAVKMYHGHYTKVLDWQGYAIAIQEALSHEGLNVIEVPTNRDKNHRAHKALWDLVSREIQSFLQDVQ